MALVINCIHLRVVGDSESANYLKSSSSGCGSSCDLSYLVVRQLSCLSCLACLSVRMQAICASP